MPFLFWGLVTNNPEKAPLSMIRRGSQDPWAPNRPTPLPLSGTFSHGSTRLPAQKLPAVASPSPELDALRVDNSRFPSFRLATLFAVATCRYLLRFAFLYLISFFLQLIATIHLLRLLSPPTAAHLDHSTARWCFETVFFLQQPWTVRTIGGNPIDVLDDHPPGGLD